MGWNHPDISLEEMMKLIEGFVDILVLASGYQSSGLLAHWDSDNIKRAFQWALFFENVFRRLSSFDAYQESIQELDAALSEMTSHPSFPQGLAHLSSVTLRSARSFLSEHLLHNLPLRDLHLRAVITGIVEMDLSDLSQTEHDCLNAYLNNLTLQSRIYMRDTSTSSPDLTPTVQTEKSGTDNFTKIALHELFRRQSSVSCVSVIEEGLDVLSNAMRHSSRTDSDSSLFREQMNHETVPALLRSEPMYFVSVHRSADALVDVVTWNRWKSRALSYFLDKRTIRMVSGASLIFSDANAQWQKVFGQLHISEKSSKNDLHQAIELLLLGSIASRWNCIIEHLMSASYDSVTISKQYHVLANLVFEISQSSHQIEEIKKSKEGGILDYLTGLLGGQIHLLWKSSPALAAVSLPFWPTLFRLYLSEIEIQFKGKPSMIRCCSCTQDRNEHKHYHVQH
ncbi:FANCF domain-containing protein [Gossypium australe]|uniref:FANCF domain-containing protein n=1 Tax=Gossypium australe TaxID=47621 RepID=A0A5B6UNA1_9ROSI|nr:FANCF domain-containing protein [Gossypium australe]